MTTATFTKTKKQAGEYVIRFSNGLTLVAKKEGHRGYWALRGVENEELCFCIAKGLKVLLDEAARRYEAGKLAAY